MHRPLPIVIILLALSGAGCAKLQPGYYLTPENYPTTAPRESSTPTMLSTIQTLTTPTLTPLPSPTPAVATSPPLPTLLATPAPLAACDETHGQIVLGVLDSQIAGRQLRYRVYLPPCYATSGRRYPYLIMLHGMQGDVMNDDQWDRLGLDEAADLGFVRGALPPMLIVMPNGVDARHQDDSGPYPEVIVKELLPAIEAHFCTWNESSKRAIGGLSRGGYWAYWIAFRHPELFDKVGGHSAFFYDAYTPTDYNPNNLVDTAPGIESLSMYLDHGAGDGLVDENMRDFVDRLRARGIMPNYVINPVGGHDETYWSAHTADYLAFYASDWPRDPSQFPYCAAPSP